MPPRARHKTRPRPVRRGILLAVLALGIGCLLLSTGLFGLWTAPQLLRGIAGLGAIACVLFLLWKGSGGGDDNGPYAGHTGGQWGIPSA